jgi:hypothetical protein
VAEYVEQWHFTGEGVFKHAHFAHVQILERFQHNLVMLDQPGGIFVSKQRIPQKLEEELQNQKETRVSLM